MGLRQIQKIISENIYNLEVKSTPVPNLPNPVFIINNVIIVNIAIHAFEKLELFESDISLLKTSSLYNSPNDEIKVNPNENQIITTTLRRLNANAKVLLDALGQALGSNHLDGDKTISIKIEKIKDFDDLSLLIDKLKKVIQLPLSEFEEGGEIKIINFDSGSFWFDILLPTTESLILLGSIAWAGAVIYKKYLEAFAFKSYAQGLEIQKDHLKTLQEAAEKKIELDIEAEAKLIQNGFYKSEDLEQLGRLKLSIKEYSKLIQNGVEIQPALTSPENISNLFPNYKLIDLIHSQVKQIGGDEVSENE